MLAKAIRSLTYGTVETKSGLILTGPLSLDRYLNVTIAGQTISGTEIRYLRMGDEELAKIVELDQAQQSLRPSTKNANDHTTTKTKD
ncbi:hypothetical protein NEHOM01_1760 [Nematocida homosporus]|uniref:uncharacterized protein n=1 Tax=Nematocida homosporus TaxID=1912981 RepID=UPI00221F43C8|nr:uncharacterized protein NEHOM01_1760 [Nematocida homosporus]KAI5186871.1 hypothetical protein NEHOM01_1760 [Nematocida homosporus]